MISIFFTVLIMCISYTIYNNFLHSHIFFKKNFFRLTFLGFFIVKTADCLSRCPLS